MISIVVLFLVFFLSFYVMIQGARYLQGQQLLLFTQIISISILCSIVGMAILLALEHLFR